MQRDRHPDAQGGGGGVHAFGAIGPEDEVPVLVAPIPDVVGEDVRTHAQSLHPPVLRRSGQLTVRDRVPVVPARNLGQHPLDGVEEELRGFVAVAVDMDDRTGRMVGAEGSIELLR